VTILWRCHVKAFLTMWRSCVYARNNVREGYWQRLCLRVGNPTYKASVKISDTHWK